MKKKLSVILPVYNVEKYIDNCLYKLVNQTIDDYEIIIIIDGSQDGSIDIVKKYKEKYPDLIKIYETENKGASAARNFGLEKSNGEFIGFVDSDDWVKITMFEKMYNYAVKNKCDIVVCDYCKVIGQIQNEVILDINNEDNIGDKVIKSRPYAWNKLYRKSVFQKYKLKFPEGIIFEDICTIYPLLLQVNKIGYINERLYYYNIRTNSVMSNKKREDLKMLEVLKILNDYCKEQKIFEKYQEVLYDINVRHIYYRMMEMRNYNNTKKYNMEFIKKGFKLLDKEFPEWRNRSNYAKNMKSVRKTILYWQLRNLLVG